MSAEMKQTLHEKFVENLTRESSKPWKVFETGIPMRDGIELAADVYMPKERRWSGAGNRPGHPIRQNRRLHVR